MGNVRLGERIVLIIEHISNERSVTSTDGQ